MSVHFFFLWQLEVEGDSEIYRCYVSYRRWEILLYLLIEIGEEILLLTSHVLEQLGEHELH